MDSQYPVVGQQEHDHFKQVARVVGPDGELLRRITVGIEVDDDDRVIQGMVDGGIADAVTSG